MFCDVEELKGESVWLLPSEQRKTNLIYPWKQEYRIKRTLEFRSLQKSGRKWKTENFLFIYKSSALEHSRIGLVVSKKVGCAVVRNKVKRRLREAARYNYFQLKQKADVVIIAFSSSSKVTFEQLEIQVSAAFKSIARRV